MRGAGGPVELCPRRSRCARCGVTHVLSPATALLRRADTAAVIVSALAAKATTRVGFAELLRIWRVRPRGAGLAALVC